MPIKWKTKILLAKIEATYGVDAAPTGAANAILATDVIWTPMEGSDVSRDLETPYMGAQGTIPIELHAKLAFKVELSPSGSAGTAPAWGPLLRACAVAEVITAGVSVAYNPVSDNHESLSMHLWIDGTRYVMVGGRGNCSIMVNAQGVPYLEFEFTGLYSTPAETARVTPSLGAFKKPQVATNTNTPGFTINAADFVMRSCKLDLGNQVENRFLIGSEGILITDKSDVVEATIEAVQLTTFDPFTLAEAQTGVALNLVHGTGAGRITTLDVPTAQIQRPQGLLEAQGIKEWPLRFVPLPAIGNDQWTLTLT
jgi:tail tube protein